MAVGVTSVNIAGVTALRAADEDRENVTGEGSPIRTSTVQVKNPLAQVKIDLSCGPFHLRKLGDVGKGLQRR